MKCGAAELLRRPRWPRRARRQYRAHVGAWPSASASVAGAGIGVAAADRESRRASSGRPRSRIEPCCSSAPSARHWALPASLRPVDGELAGGRLVEARSHAGRRRARRRTGDGRVRRRASRAPSSRRRLMRSYDCAEIARRPPTGAVTLYVISRWWRIARPPVGRRTTSKPSCADALEVVAAARRLISPERDRRRRSTSRRAAPIRRSSRARSISASSSAMFSAPSAGGVTRRRQRAGVDDACGSAMGVGGGGIDLTLT